MQRLKEWREMIRDVWRHHRLTGKLAEEERSDNPDEEKIENLQEGVDNRYQRLHGVKEILHSDERFYSLRSHLSEQTKQDMVPNPRRIEVRSGSGPPGELKTLLREIDRIEKEWGLLE